MRKLMVAVVAVAGVVAGCREGVKDARQDVAEARQGVQQEQQEMQQELAEQRKENRQDLTETRQENQEELAGERQEGQQELAEQRQDVQDERQELMEARQERAEEGTGGGAMAGSQQVNGRIQSATPDAVVLIVPEQNNQQMRLRADQQTQVKKNDQTMSLKDLKPGDEIRASYEMGQNGQLILRSVEVTEKPSKMKDDLGKMKDDMKK